MRALHEYAARAAAAADYVRDWFMAQKDGQTVMQRRSQMRRADAARIEATTVDRALAMGTDEATIQLAGQRDAFVRRLDELRTPGRALTRPESLELFHLAESVKRIDAATFGAGAIDPQAKLAEFGAVARPRGFLGMLGGAGPLQWIAAGGAAFGLLGFTTAAVQGARLNHAKGELADVRADLTASTRALADARQVNADLAANIAAAANNARADAETINRANARAAAARERERRVLREIQERTATVGDPPAWSLRDGAGGDPAGPGSDSSGNPG